MMTRRGFISSSSTMAAAGAAKIEIAGADTACASTRPLTVRDVDAVFPPITGPRPQVAAFYWQSWTHDPARMQALHLPPNYTEWDHVAQAKPVASCEVQPKVPAWGQFDAADPRMSEREITAASGAGIDVFVFTWLHGNGRTVQNSPLDQAFLKASNHASMKFALVWVNHDDPQIKLDYAAMNWDELASAASAYTAQSNYWRVNGHPVLGVNDYGPIVKALGAAATKQRIAGLKAKGFYVFCSGDFLREPDPGSLGFDACTSYNAISFIKFARGVQNTVIPYREAALETMDLWRQYKSSAPLHPSCPVGWDNSSRIGAKARIVVGRSADQYAALITAAKRYAWQKRHNPGIVFLSSWNEWSEDHYLLPDQQFGDAYLKAVKEAVG
jgi:hypothetical protein